MGSATHTPATHTWRGEDLSVQHFWCVSGLLQLHPIWCTRVDTIKLQHVQNTLAQVVLQRPKQTHAEPLLYTLHWLPMKQHIHFKLATLTHKIRATSTPHYLNELILPRMTRTRMSLWSASRTLLRVPPTRMVIASRAFSVCAPVVWNSLPDIVQSCDYLKLSTKDW